MDWKIFGTSFVAIFLAEFGDKTQLAAMSLASDKNQSVIPVLAGVTLAFVACGVVGVGAGRLIGQALDPTWVKWGSGLLFIGIGVYTLIKPV